MANWEYKTVSFPAEFELLGGGGNVNTEEIECELNRLANKGWRLVSIFTSNKYEGGTRDVIAVLERMHD